MGLDWLPSLMSARDQACSSSTRPGPARLRLTCFGRDVRAADPDLHVEPGLLVEALRRRGVIAGELRLVTHSAGGDLRQLLFGSASKALQPFRPPPRRLLRLQRCNSSDPVSTVLIRSPFLRVASAILTCCHSMSMASSEAPRARRVRRPDRARARIDRRRRRRPTLA